MLHAAKYGRASGMKKTWFTDGLPHKPMAAAVELIRLSDGQMLTRSVSDPKTGEFLIVLPTGQDYLLNVIRKDYLFHSEHFSLPPGRATEHYLLDIALLPITPGGEGILRNVFFATGSAALDDRSVYELKQLLRLLCCIDIVGLKPATLIARITEPRKIV